MVLVSRISGYKFVNLGCWNQQFSSVFMSIPSVTFYSTLPLSPLLSFPFTSCSFSSPSTISISPPISSFILYFILSFILTFILSSSVLIPALPPPQPLLPRSPFSPLTPRSGRSSPILLLPPRPRYLYSEGSGPGSEREPQPRLRHQRGVCGVV